MQDHQPSLVRKSHRVIILCIAVGLLILSCLAGVLYLVKKPPLSALIRLFDSLDRYDIQAVDSTIGFDLGTDVLNLDNRLHIVPTSKSGKWLVFLLHNQATELKAHIGDNELKVRRLWVFSAISLPKEFRAKPFTLKLSYRGNFQRIFNTPLRSYVNSGTAYVERSNLWLPVQTNTEYPEPKNMFEFLIPTGMTAFTDGTLAQSSTLSTHQERHLFTDVRAPQFVIGSQKQWLFERGGWTVRLNLLPEYGHQADTIGQWALDILERYEGWFGAPASPFKTVTITQLEENGTRGGICDQNMITMGKFHFDELDKYLKYRQEKFDPAFYELLSHELSHLWWHYGENFSVSSLLDSQWYVEGLAEYSGLLSMQTALNSPTMTQIDFNDRGSLFNRRLESKRIHLSNHNFKPLQQYTNLEGSNIPYYKGSLMFNSLHQKFGDAEFFKLVENMQKNYTPRQMDKILQQLLEERQVADAGIFLNHWLEDTKVLDFSIKSARQQVTADGVQLIVQIEGLVNRETPITLRLIGQGFEETRRVTVVKGKPLQLHLSSQLTGIEVDPYHEYLESDLDNNLMGLSLPDLAFGSPELEKTGLMTDVEIFTHPNWQQINQTVIADNNSTIKILKTQVDSKSVWVLIEENISPDGWESFKKGISIPMQNLNMINPHNGYYEPGHLVKTFSVSGSTFHLYRFDFLNTNSKREVELTFLASRGDQKSESVTFSIQPQQQELSQRFGSQEGNLRFISLTYHSLDARGRIAIKLPAHLRYSGVERLISPAVMLVDGTILNSQFIYHIPTDTPNNQTNEHELMLEFIAPLVKPGTPLIFVFGGLLSKTVNNFGYEVTTGGVLQLGLEISINELSRQFGFKDSLEVIYSSKNNPQILALSAHAFRGDSFVTGWIQLLPSTKDQLLRWNLRLPLADGEQISKLNMELNRFDSSHPTKVERIPLTIKDLGEESLPIRQKISVYEVSVPRDLLKSEIIEYNLIAKIEVAKPNSTKTIFENYFGNLTLADSKFLENKDKELRQLIDTLLKVISQGNENELPQLAKPEQSKMFWERIKAKKLPEKLTKYQIVQIQSFQRSEKNFYYQYRVIPTNNAWNIDILLRDSSTPGQYLIVDLR